MTKPRTRLETGLITALGLVVCGLILRGWFTEIDGLRTRMTTVEATVGDHAEWITGAKERVKADLEDRKGEATLEERREQRKALTGILAATQQTLAEIAATQRLLAEHATKGTP